MTASPNKYFRDCVLLFFLTLIVYWPLSLNYLSLKNDALVQYLAYRYHLSEALRHGYFPFWSPYLYTGFPIHADMQGEVWNPFVLFLSLVSKYDMTILQFEVLTYLFIAAIGMYRLIKFLGLSRATAICCAVSFMCCGYMTDSISVIPWIPSAAFIPFVLLYFLRSLRSIQLSDAIKFSLSLSLMFLCGYPSFFIFLNYIVGFIFFLWLICQVRNGSKQSALKVFLHLGLAYILFLIVCSPAIISYYEFLPYYSRGSGISYQKAIVNPFHPFSAITYLLPGTGNKMDSLPTDLSMRNAYIGLFVFLFFLISLKKLNRFKSSILFFTLFSFLFSLGDLTPIQKFSYDVLPLIRTFRHPGTIRIFTSVGMILLASYPLDAFLERNEEKKIRWLCYGVLVLFIASAIYFLSSGSLPGNIKTFGLHPSTLKQYFYGISFEQLTAIVSLVQIIFIAAFLFFQRRKPFSKNSFLLLFILNSVAFAWMAMPSIVSQYRTSEVNKYIHSFPDGYPMPDVNAPVGSEVYSDSILISPHGYDNFYNKKITIQDHIITPTLNSDYYQFLESKTLRWQLKGYPFVYVANDSGVRRTALIKLLKFSPNNFLFEVSSETAGKLNLFQQYNHNWHVVINKQSVAVQKSNIAFMSVNLPAGQSLIEWKYQPKEVYAAMILSALSLVAVLFYFVFKRRQERIYE
jgi:Bacterial membrane protein YfhO